MYIGFRDPLDFVTQIQSLPLEPDESLLICFEQTVEPHLDQILDLLSKVQVDFFGAIFPALIHGGKICKAGAIVQAYKLLAAPSVARIDGEAVVWTRPLPEMQAVAEKPTCLILADFSCVAITSLLDELFNRHANDINYFGGGAGTGVREPSPVLFSNEGRFTGSALVAYLATKGDVNLRHGWSRTSDPVVATRTQGNIIKELNWEPAITVYRSLVGEEVANSLSRREDIPKAKRFPFGIAREDLEDVVRDPLLSTEQGELVVLSHVQEHSVLHILQADPESLIQAAAALAADFAATDQGARCLLFDCYSRAMLLDRDFPKELRAFESTLQTKLTNCPVEGVLALGEIASDGNRLPDFHNKTMAAGVFYVGS